MTKKILFCNKIKFYLEYTTIKEIEMQYILINIYNNNNELILQVIPSIHNHVFLNNSILFKENSLPSLSCLSCQYINNPANTILSTTEKKITDAVGNPGKIQG